MTQQTPQQNQGDMEAARAAFLADDDGREPEIIEGDEPEEPGEPEEPQGEPEPVDDVESRARALGWKPPTEWKGPPPAGGLVEDPAAFIASHERSNERLKNEVAELRGVLTRTETHIEALRRGYERQRERDLRDLEARIQAGVDAGDRNAVNSALKERDKLLAGDEPKPQPYDAQKDPAFHAWVETDDAAWYRTARPDDPRVIYAQAVGARLARQGVTPQTHRENYYLSLSAEVRRAFPDAQPTPRTEPEVETGRRTAAPQRQRRDPSKTKWSDLPASVRNDQQNQSMLRVLYKGDKDKFAQAWATTQEA